MAQRADAAGCVVYRYDELGRPRILLIHDPYGMWTLPKGHLERGENEETAAVREVREETGIDGALGARIGSIVYTVRKKGAPYQKEVVFFLMRASGGTAVPQAAEGISAAEWFVPHDALQQIGYDQVRDMLARALTIIPPHE